MHVSFAQVIRTVVPKEAVVVGDAFQVQYIVEGHSAESLRPPVFTNFRVVSGPSFYKGNTEDEKPVVNAVYTLEPLRPGKFIIHGATLFVGETKIKSNNAEIVVLSVEAAVERKEAVNDYFLRPGEDPYQKIRENIFIRVKVNKRNVYVGQPVQAIFKLYSRLQSRSDIIKNPGFYGFSVYDQVNLADKESTVENIGGKLFDVHTVRKVQLFPLQAGNLLIDEMEVRNRVEFSRSAVSKKTEQEIAEGMSVFEEENETLTSGSEIFESEMHTEPVLITVKPLPLGEKPENFQGAVGEFSIETSVDQLSLALGKKAEFILKIKGAGNFMQIDAPRLNWPVGMEVFEPRVEDDFDRRSFPLQGERVFRYPFVLSKTGMFTISELELQFFDPDSGKYRRATANATSLYLKERAATVIPGTLKTPKKRTIFVWILLGGFLLVAVIFYYYRKGTRQKVEIFAKTDNFNSLEYLWEKAAVNPQLPLNVFYKRLALFSWQYFERRLFLNPGQLNKNALFASLHKKKVDGRVIEQLKELFIKSEAAVFTNANLEINLEKEFIESFELFQKLDTLL